MQPLVRCVLALLVAASALLQPEAQSICALVAIIVLGVPHGALDGEIARDVLHRRFGWTWFPIFAVPYLALSALVLLAWRALPLATLSAFLAASVGHFGSEDAAGGSLLEKGVRGGLPIAAPLLLQPATTDDLFAAVAGVPLTWAAHGLALASMVWASCAITWSVLELWRGHGRPLVTPGLLVCGFAVLPPLVAFAVYFVCVHAPAHTNALIASSSRARRVHDARCAARLALPLTLVTFALGLALWPLYVGSLPARLLALTLQGLSALTLPHMLLDCWTSRRAQEAPHRDGARAAVA